MVLCSGGFDPLHVGHLAYLHGASQYGHVAVALNSDSWLKRKKGYAFMPWQERMEILNAIRYVQRVLKVADDDGSVAEAIRRLRPEFFCNGGDRTTFHPLEHKACLEVGARELFWVGGRKIRSSSRLIAEACRGMLRP